jgi:hypothetical protein
MVPILPQTSVQDGGDEDIETKSKEKEGIAKDGLGPSSNVLKTLGKKKKLVTRCQLML